MRIAAAPEWRRAGSGFTLIELLLTLVVLLLLLGAIVINFTGLQSGVQLDEGAEQFESLIRYARAHAANTGCKVQLSFEELIGDDKFEVPLGNVFVSWEPEPLEHPGEFKPLAEVSPLLESLMQLVEVNDVRPLDGISKNISSTAGGISDGGEDEAKTAFAPITFYPDGSSDSAEIILRARDSEEERKLAIRIIGATGTVKRVAVEENPAEPQVAQREKTGAANAN